MIWKFVKIILLIAALTFNCFPLDGYIEEGWKNIKPLQTDRKTVEKILGSPEASRENYSNYDTGDFFVHIEYSTGSCAENNYERGYYDISSDTVISYNVILSEPINLANFKFKRERDIGKKMTPNAQIYFTITIMKMLYQLALPSLTESNMSVEFDFIQVQRTKRSLSVKSRKRLLKSLKSLKSSKLRIVKNQNKGKSQSLSSPVQLFLQAV